MNLEYVFEDKDEDRLHIFLDVKFKLIDVHTNMNQWVCLNVDQVEEIVSILQQFLKEVSDGD